MKRMRCLVLEPGYYPYVSMFQNLDDMIEQLWEEPVEITLPFDNNVITLIYQDNQIGLPHNRVFGDSQNIGGRAVICGWDGKQMIGLTKAQANRYYRRFLYPEQVEETSDGKVVSPCPNPKNKPMDERFGKKPNWLER